MTPDQIIQEQTRLASDRGNFEAQWQEVSERAIPRARDLFFAAGEQRSTGEKKTDKMLDSTAAIALERYSAILASLLTPESQKWHRLRSTSPELNRIPNVARWYDEATDILFRQRRSPRSGFYGQMNESYLSIGGFGTGLVFTDHANPSPTDPAGGLRYRNIHLSESFLKENHQGNIDTVYRKFKLTHRQAMQMVEAGTFDILPSKINKLKPEDSYAYIHCVMPNTEFDPNRLDFKGMPYSSHYVCVQTKQIIKQSGYHSFPYAIGRSSVTPGETYGRSPAMLVLPNIKVLNEQKKTYLQIGHSLVRGVYLAHDDGVLDTFSLKPGTINAGGVNADGRKLIQRLDDNQGQLSQANEMMVTEKEVINDAFLMTLFQILVDTPRMTATEVLERTREKAMLMAPTMGRLQSDKLGSLIERELDLMVRNGRMPEMPPELIEAQGEYEVQYDSPLSRVMRAEEAAGFSRWMEQLLAASQITQDPAPLDWVDWDTAAPELADINAVPNRWIATQDAVAQKREGRDQQQAVQTAIDASSGVADLVKAGAGQ